MLSKDKSKSTLNKDKSKSTLNKDKSKSSMSREKSNSALSRDKSKSALSKDKSKSTINKTKTMHSDDILLLEDSLVNMPEPGVEIPPNPENRIFNEHDVLGEIERDDNLDPIPSG